jgi:N-acetylmuramic acid 6-phosphate etherase
MFLGIEGGGTHTVALIVDGRGGLKKRVEAGPANFRLLTDAQLEELLEGFTTDCARPSAIGIGLAGVRDDKDRARLRAMVNRVWPGVPVAVGNDLETALAASSEAPESPASARVVIISGTGSCVFGRTRAGESLKVGGWGHLLGDRGSGYEVGLKAARSCIQEYDRTGRWPALGERLLRVLLLNEPNDLIAWAQQAPKAAIAALAVEVFGAASEGDRLARRLVNETAASLAADGVSCARRLCGKRARVEFVLAGSVFSRQPTFARAVLRGIRSELPLARGSVLQREGAWGAVEMARAIVGGNGLSQRVLLTESKGAGPIPSSPVEWTCAESSPTEQRNPRSIRLEQLSVEEAVALMLDEERLVEEGLKQEVASIAKAIRLIVAAFRKGGRLFYAGAGTSGRLGVLDASECPPTFSVPSDLVQGIMAGGQEALWRPVEGAEDDAAAGARAAEHRGVRRGDVFVGIAASGRTPFVWGALDEARRRGAKTVLVSFNPSLRIPRERRPDVVVAPNVGPEVLTGSTRLKSGTATKLVLNLFTTLAMVRLGKVVSNLMVDLNPSNVKLRGRAIRIVRELTGVDEAEARKQLEASGWMVKRALERCGFRTSRR